jgi:RimJ/RimL family protein N-acetyltransferase
MEVTIRRVTASDWLEMKRLRLAALATDRMAFGSTFEAESAFGDDVWIDRARASATSDERATWVALDRGGRMIGMLGVLIEEEGAKLFGTWVDPVARGEGVAGRMLDTVIAWVEAGHPALPIALSVNPAFEAAVRLYRSRGFEPDGCREPIPHAPSMHCARMIRRRA